MSKYKVSILNINTSSLEVLSDTEMNLLFREYQNGNDIAKERLVIGNLKLVLSLLKSYVNKVDNMDDLFQVGVVGLIKAIDNFDLSHEVKFSTYAVPMILGEVKRYIRDNSSLRVSRSIKDMAYKILKAKEYLTNELGMEATPKEICDFLKISDYDFSLAIDSLKDTLSMSETIYSDGGDPITIADQVANPKEAYDIDIKISFYDAIKKIKEREKYVLIERYLIGKTQTELSEELGISQAQVSRLEKSGIDSIKRLIK